MPTWSPPTVQDVPRVLPDTRGVARYVMRHYSNLVRGQNVYVLDDGTVTEDHPGDGTVRLTLFGAHVPQTISQADADILTTAGYGANVS